MQHEAALYNGGCCHCDFPAQTGIQSASAKQTPKAHLTRQRLETAQLAPCHQSSHWPALQQQQQQQQHDQPVQHLPAMPIAS
jgi:hypothetical protein